MGFIFNKKAPIKAAERSALREIGDTGTSIYEGVIDEEYNTKLKGAEGVKKYDEMRRSDATVRASVLVCTLPIRAANWFVEPADEDEKNKEVAAFVEHNLFDGMTITWDDFLRQALLMLPLGVMLFEKVFQNIEYEGKPMIGFRKLAPRLPKSVAAWQTIEKKDGVSWDKIDGHQVSIPIEKLLIFVNEKEGENWWGTSILRATYKHWFFKNNYYKIDAIAFERQGLGIPKCKMPEDATPEDEDKAKEILKNIRTHEEAFLIEPYDYEFEFMDMKGGTARSPKDAIAHHNREIVLSVLAQFLELGASSVGSRALSEDHSSLFYLSLIAIAKQICDVINNYAIKQLVDLNYTVEKYPKLMVTKVGSVDYDKLSTAIQRLSQAGVLTTDDKLERHVRELLSLPEKEEMEEEEKPEVEETPEEEELKKKAQASDMRFQEPFKGWRKLTYAETKVHLKSIQEHFDKYEKEFATKTTSILKKSKSKLLTEFEIALKKKDIAALRKIALKYQGPYREEITGLLKKSYDFAKTNAAKEMGVTAPPTPNAATTRMALQADMIAKRHADEVIYTAKKVAVENLGKGVSVYQTMGAVDRAIDRQITKMVNDTGNIVVGGSISQGRRLVQQKYSGLIYAIQRSEILDERTCDFCLSIDGRIFDKKDPFTKNDIFHSSCRGLWVEIMMDEKEKPPIKGAPKVLTDRFGGEVNELIQPRKPIVKKVSPAAEFLKTKKT